MVHATGKNSPARSATNIPCPLRHWPSAVKAIGPLTARMSAINMEQVSVVGDRSASVRMSRSAYPRGMGVCARPISRDELGARSVAFYAVPESISWRAQTSSRRGGKRGSELCS